MPAMADQYKSKYCKSDNSGCARHMVFKALGRENVPSNLFPHQLEDARKLAAAG